MFRAKSVLAAAVLCAICMILTAMQSGVSVAVPDDAADGAVAPALDDAPADDVDSLPEPPQAQETTAYHSWREMVAEIKQIATDHSNIVMLTSIGKSWHNRDIWALKISDNPNVEEAGEPEVYFNSNHHAREWMTIEVALYIANYLTDNYGTNSSITSIVNSRQIWIIPTANPDGRVYDGLLGGDDPTVHAADAASGWRKNVRDNNADGQFTEAADGVDLNRNYGYGWGGAGASSDPTQITYGGPTAFSEPETQAIRDFARQHKFVFAISYHSYSQLILYPEGWNYISNTDTIILQNVAKGMSQRISNTAGDAKATYTPEQSSALYTTTGSDDDWLYGELGIYAFCIELYPSVAPASPYDGFHPNPSKISAVCYDNIRAALWLCQIADNPYQAIDHVKVVPRSTDIKVTKGSSGNVIADVTDDGVRSGTFTISCTTPSGWTASTVSPNSLTLAQNGVGQTTLTVNVPSGATPGTYKVWVNATMVANASCKGSSVVMVTVPSDGDASVTSQTPFVEKGTYAKGSYRIGATVKNVGAAATGAFNAYCNITRLGATANRVVFSDTMESGTAKWTTIDYDGTMQTTNTWHQITTSSHSATHSWYCGPAALGSYALNTIQAIEMAQSVDLRTATGANLTLWTYYNIENGYDYLTVEGSRDNGKTWEYVTRYTGTATAWTNRTVAVSPFIGSSQVKFRLKFSEDGGTTANPGFLFDDVYLTVQVPVETPVYGPTAQAIASLAVDVTAIPSWTYAFTTAGRYRVATWSALSADGQASNNYTDRIITIDGTKALPDFAGAVRAENTGTGTAINVSWAAANDPNAPITYSLYRFDHSPSAAEVNASSPIWTGTSLYRIDAGLTLSSTYYYVVRAEDSLTQKDYNLVVRSASTDDVLYLQVQSSLAGFKDLALAPFETAIQTASSTTITATGQYMLGGADDQWVSVTYASAQSMDGTWKFSARGKMSYSGAHGNLYAKVFRQSDAGLLFTTVLDDEDVAGHYAAYHEFYWEHTVSGASLPAGGRFYVELWLSVTAMGTGAGSTTYKYVGVTQAAGPHDAWFCDVDDNTEFELSTPNSVTEMTDANYGNIATSNGAYAVSAQPGTSDEIFAKYSMAVTNDPATITGIALMQESRVSAGTVTATMYAFNALTSSWDQVGTTVSIGTTDVVMNRSITSSWFDYISDGKLTWGVYTAATGTVTTSVDYAVAVISYTIPNAAFTLGYDNTATPSWMSPVMTLASSSAWSNITVASGWNLISVPISGPTTMPGALADKTGGVVWTRAMWYNPATPADPWMQYNSAWSSALNDLTAVNNTMGVWLFVTTVGDGQICVGGAGYTTPTTTGISLKIGWNLIGFPSDDTTFTVAMLKGLFPAITIVEGYSGAATYLTGTMNDSDLMAAGKGYWVLSTADGTLYKPF